MVALPFWSRRDSPAKSENQANLNPAADPVRGAGSGWFWAVGGLGKRFGVLAQCHQIPAASVRFKMASRRNRRRLPHTRTAPPSHRAGLRHRRTRSNDSASTPRPAVSTGSEKPSWNGPLWFRCRETMGSILGPG